MHTGWHYSENVPSFTVFDGETRFMDAPWIGDAVFSQVECVCFRQIHSVLKLLLNNRCVSRFFSFWPEAWTKPTPNEICFDILKSHSVRLSQILLMHCFPIHGLLQSNVYFNFSRGIYKHYSNRMLIISSSCQFSNARVIILLVGGWEVQTAFNI